MTSMAKNIAIVAHSYGGILTMKMMDIHPNFFQNYVKAIAFTDSVHDADQRQHYTDYFKGVSEIITGWETLCSIKGFVSHAPNEYRQ